MKIVIIGAGEVGLYLARRLSSERHDLVWGQVLKYQFLNASPLIALLTVI
ncbi:MAG: hypothetical protein ACUVT6_13365 [Thermodesulfobacteriota bacterium]